MKNDYKHIEKLLNSYKSIQSDIKILYLEIEELKDDVSIASTNFDAVDSGKCDSKGNSSKVENEVLQRERRIAEKEREIRYKKRTIDIIDAKLEDLTEEDRKFIKLRYFDKIPMNDLAKRYNVEPRTMYHRKDKVILKLVSKN